MREFGEKVESKKGEKQRIEGEDVWRTKIENLVHLRRFIIVKEEEKKYSR